MPGVPPIPGGPAGMPGSARNPLQGWPLSEQLRDGRSRDVSLNEAVAGLCRVA
jgi:hypothetical protein